MHSFWLDLRYGARMLAKAPGFTIIAVLTLALGIGANTAIFSVVNAVLLSPLPFQRPEELLVLWERNPSLGWEENAPAAANYADWLAQNRVFSGLAIYDGFRKFNFASSDRPERISGAAVSASLFDVLAVSPLRGRLIRPEEEQPGSDQVALVSYSLWQTRFAADPDLVGKAISLNERSYTVIGIMPEGFQFPGGSGTQLRIYTPPRAEVWIPLALNENQWRSRTSHYLSVIARLKPGVSIEQAQSEMTTIQAQLDKQYPGTAIGTHVKAIPLSSQVVGKTRRSLLVLWGTVAFVLLIACANVANLLMARAAARRKEVAVRSALGASRLRVIRQLLTESLLLSLAGGIAGVLLAAWGVAALEAIIPSDFPRREGIAIDFSVFAFTLLISVLTGLIFGLAPALQSSKLNLTESLKEGGRDSSESGRNNRIRGLLVVGETALALVLLIGAALMIQSFMRLQRVDPGFKTDHVLTMEISLPQARYQRPQRADFIQRLISQGRTIPGVETVAASKHLPLAGDNMHFAFDVEGRPFPPGRSPGVDVRGVTPDYFTTLGIPLISGRTFTDSDGPNTPPVLAINQSMARKHFPNEDPLGKRLVLGINNFTGTITGVVGDVKHRGLDIETASEAYVAYAQAPYWGDMSLLVRTSGDPMSVMSAMRQKVRELDNALPLSKERTLETIAVESVAQPRFGAALIGLFGVLALMLASVGIYGVMSYSVVRRTHEIGVRMALGARDTDVLRLVVGQGLKLVSAGVAVGLAASFALTRLMEGLLFQTSPTDKTTFAVIAVALVSVALLACWLPARRATKVDPMVALRYE